MPYEVSPMPLVGVPITAHTQMASQTLKTSQPPPAIDPKPTPDSTTLPAGEITAETSPQDAVRIAAQIRNEKKIRQAARQVEDDRRKLVDEHKQYEPWKKAADISKKSKLAAIRELGITYEDLTSEMLNEGVNQPRGTPQPNVEAIVAEQIAKFRKEQEDNTAKQHQQSYAAAIKQIDGEVKLIADTTGKYPLVKESGAYHDITEFIETEFHRTGIIIPVEEALAKVENEIADGILHLAKIANIQSQPPVIEGQKIEPIAAQPIQKITTLTHKASAAVGGQPLSPAERRQRAINVAMGLPPT